MSSANCPSCGAILKPGAVLCVACGLDLRTGRRLTTEVISSTAATERSDVGDHERFACEKLQFCQLAGVFTRILVCDDDERVLAYIRHRSHPFWTCFTILIAASLFFLVPFGLGALFVVVAEQAKIPAPGILLSIILITLAFAIGLVVSFGTANLMTPRRRAKIWEDEPRRRLLMRVVETWKWGVAKISVIGGDGRPVGYILHHRRRYRYWLLNSSGQPLAVLVSGKLKYTAEWTEEHSPMMILLRLLLLGLPGLLLGLQPRTERARSEWFFHRSSSLLEKPGEKIGRVTFNPVRQYPYRAELPGDPDRSVDRALVVALVALFEW